LFLDVKNILLEPSTVDLNLLKLVLFRFMRLLMFLAWATAKLARSVGSLFGLTDAAGGAVAAVVNRVGIWTGFCVW